MRKILYLFLLLFVTTLTHAQTEKGLYYYELAELAFEGNQHNEAMELYAEAYKEGVDSSLINISYLNILYATNPENLEIAFYAAQQGASIGYGDCMYVLGLIYSTESLEIYDLNTSLYWLYQAREQKIPEAINYIGTLHRIFAGQGDFTMESSIKYLEEAANLGSKNAYLNLGTLYYQDIEQPNYEEAFKWLSKSAEAGNSNAMWGLGEMYLHGEGVKKDYKKAYNWYLESALRGEPLAMFSLGEMYEKGIGVKKDYVIAYNWYKNAEWYDSQEATEALKSFVNYPPFRGNEYYLAGLDFFNKREYEKSYELMFAASKKGNVMAYTILGHYSFDGYGCEKNRKTAMKWYKKAAQKNESSAIYNIGLLYLQGGEGIKKDYKEAQKWFEKAALLGHAEAMNYAGIMNNGYYPPIPKDEEKMIYWLEKATNFNSSSAYVNLANNYLNESQDPNLFKVFSLFHRAAILGNPQAMYIVGNMYEEGHGTFIDIDKAMEWYESAAELGVNEARQRLRSRN